MVKDVGQSRPVPFVAQRQPHQGVDDHGNDFVIGFDELFRCRKDSRVVVLLFRSAWITTRIESGVRFGRRRWRLTPGVRCTSWLWLKCLWSLWC